MSFFFRFVSQDAQNDVKRPGKRFRKNVRTDVCECVCACVRAHAGVCFTTSENSSFCISGIAQPIELKFDVHLKQTRLFF